MNKEQLERLYKHSLKVKKVLFIVSMCLFGAAVGSLVSFIILRANNVDMLLIPDYVTTEITLTLLLIDAFDTFLAGGIVCLLFSVLIYARRARVAKSLLDNYDQMQAQNARAWGTMPSSSEPEVVDVKPIYETKPKGKYDDLIHEYELLYERGLITKEDLENKKKELGY